jgi:transcriptional regulator with XRE-family HTH domain
LGRRLREIRRELGDEDREVFASAIGISRAALAYYERGERTPDAAVLASYRSVYGVSLEWLVKGDGDMFVDPSNVPDSQKLRLIDKVVFESVTGRVAIAHLTAGLELPQTEFIGEVVDAYNALVERAENPSDTEELLSLLPWLDARLKKSLSATDSEKKSGKKRA